MVSRQDLPACYTLKDDLEDDSDDSASDEVPEYYYRAVQAGKVTAKIHKLADMPTKQRAGSPFAGNNLQESYPAVSLLSCFLVWDTHDSFRGKAVSRRIKNVSLGPRREAVERQLRRDHAQYQFVHVPRSG